MKMLVYAILRTSEIGLDPLPNGIDEREVAVVAEDGLALAFSTVPEDAAPPGKSRLAAFARVIADLGSCRTLLPVRYGTFLENEDHARDMLRRKRAPFVAALNEVEGCVEMSLRILTRLDDQEPSRRQAASDPRPRDGAAYMLSRRAYFLAQDHARQFEEESKERLQSAFAGLFVRCQREERRAENSARSLVFHFLVRRADLEDFRRAFRRIEDHEAAPVLLTGPWVPSSFLSLLEDKLLP